MLFGTLSLNVLFYGIPRSNWFYLFVEQSHLPELTENFILDEPARNTSLLRERCIQAERSEYTRFSMLEKEMRVLMDEHFLFRYMDSGG